ncbi:hypothetical protein ACA910_006535 [Epithemia clementina (nom. ined.)]
MSTATPDNSKPDKSIRQKMLSGDLYKATDDPELMQEHMQAMHLCFELNQTSPMDLEQRKALVKKLLGVEDAFIDSPFHVDYGYNIKVGIGFYANRGCTILDCNKIVIGDGCLLAPNVVISAAFHPLNAQARASGYQQTAPIQIGNNCWIGANATINPGVVIGDNVVVGAGAVVTRSVPSNVVVAGVPARIIRYISDDHQDDVKTLTENLR